MFARGRGPCEDTMYTLIIIHGNLSRTEGFVPCFFVQDIAKVPKHSNPKQQPDKTPLKEIFFPDIYKKVNPPPLPKRKKKEKKKRKEKKGATKDTSA